MLHKKNGLTAIWVPIRSVTSMQRHGVDAMEMTLREPVSEARLNTAILLAECIDVAT